MLNFCNFSKLLHPELQKSFYAPLVWNVLLALSWVLQSIGSCKNIQFGPRRLTSHHWSINYYWMLIYDIDFKLKVNYTKTLNYRLTINVKFESNLSCTLLINQFKIYNATYKRTKPGIFKRSFFDRVTLRCHLDDNNQKRNLKNNKHFLKHIHFKIYTFHDLISLQIWRAKIFYEKISGSSITKLLQWIFSKFLF